MFRIAVAGTVFGPTEADLALGSSERLSEIVLHLSVGLEDVVAEHVALMGKAEAGFFGSAGGNLVVVELTAPAVVADTLELVRFTEVVLLLAVGALLELLETVREGALVFVWTCVELEPAVADLRLRSLIFVHIWSGAC